MSHDPVFAPLLDWLAIPSVSAAPEHAPDVAKAGEWVCEHMRGVPGADLEHRLLPGGRHPAVVGRIAASDGGGRAPRIAVYAHFDVQPPGRREEWSSEPFAPEIRDGWLFGRGAADSKANCIITLEAIKRLAGEGSLPVNIELLFDGEEEIDGAGIPDLATMRPAPAAALICDGALWDDDTPCFWVSARGTLYYRLTVRTGQRELHSGTYGGAALNAAGAMIACLHGATGAGLGAGRGPTSTSPVPSQDGALALEHAGARPADASAAREFYQRTVLGSAIDVNSIGAGEVGLQKTAIPVDATADVSVRVGPADDHDRLDEEFRARLDAHLPPGAELSIETLAAIPAGETPADSEAILLAAAAFKRSFGTSPKLVGAGGTLPLFSVYAERGVPVILTGFSSPDGAAHAADECFPLRNLRPGVDAVCELLRTLGGLSRA